LNCKICNSATTRFAEAKILNKYNIAYYHCPHCGFVQTEEPYWLKEAYINAIADEDAGLVRRNLFFSNFTANLIDSVFEKTGNFLDFGGGYGLFVRLMLDKGYKFYRYDLFCENLFAKGYDVDLNQAGQYELITAFEVFEHFSSPMTEITKLRKHSNSILFCTELIDKIPPQPTEWWYYTLASGQHISFYSLETITYIARNLGLKLYTDTKQIHLFTEKAISSI
jgi:hypothetical protein